MDTNNRLRAIWHGLTSSGRYTQFIDDSDRKTFDRRFANEGAEFYARGLTSLRTAFLTGLEKGQYEGTDSCRFKTRKNSRLPTFLYRAFAAIFDDSGRRLGMVNVDAVSCLNQLLAVFGKIEGGHTRESETAVIKTFLRNEEVMAEYGSRLASDKRYIQPGHLVGLPSPVDRYKYRLTKHGWEYIMLDMQQDSKRHYDAEGRQVYLNDSDEVWDAGVITGNYVELFVLEARKLVRRVLADEDPRDVHPKHGSGRSACQTPVNRRYDMPRFIEKLDKVYPYAEYFFLNSTHLCDAMPGRVDSEPGVPASHEWLDGMPSYDPCAEVLLVPKDARGPRLISCEPRETMWIQQGLLDKLVTCLEAHPLTMRLVNFTDQRINKYQAYLGSITRETSTLDLKDASDLISWELVKRIWPENWVECFHACRSESTKLPDGTTVDLHKFAPMGSALCFPVMALTIWALLTAAANAAQVDPSIRAVGQFKRTFTKHRGYNWKCPIYVYGDDIILPTDFAVCAKLVLESVGLKVNANKCFRNSFFRESCGGEYYHGHEVTPVRLRSLPDDDVPSRMKLIAFHNNLFKATGFQPTWLTELIHQWYPRVPERSSRVPGVPDPLDSWEKHLPRIFTVGCITNADQTGEPNDQMAGVLDVNQPDNSHLPRRYRAQYNRVEFRYLAVTPKGIKYPKDRWSQVFRAVVNPRREMILGWDALAKRVSYKYRWSPLR